MEVVASLSQGRTAAAQCGLFTHKSVPIIFEPPCRCTGIYKFGNNTYPRRIRRRLNLGHIFRKKVRRMGREIRYITGCYIPWNTVYYWLLHPLKYGILLVVTSPEIRYITGCYIP